MTSPGMREPGLAVHSAPASSGILNSSVTMVLQDNADISSLGSVCTDGSGSLCFAPTYQGDSVGLCGGDILVEHSRDVHIGPKTLYYGPVFQVTSHNMDKVQHDQAADLPVACAGHGNTCQSSSCDASDFQLKALPERMLVRLLRRPWAVLTTVVVTCVLSVVVSVAVLLCPGVLSPVTDDDIGSKHPNPSGLKLVGRKQWLARDPKESLITLDLPVEYVVIQHTASNNCTSSTACVMQVAFIQQFHMDANGWNDIGCNFLVGGDGNGFEGRGWHVVEHPAPWPVSAIGICFIGHFMNEAPPAKQVHVALEIMEWAVSNWMLVPDFKVIASCQIRPTVSPGRFVFLEVMKWTHWFN